MFLAAAARMKKPSIAGVEQALYDDRTLVRVLGMRRTLFVEPLELVPIVYASSTAGWRRATGRPSRRTWWPTAWPTTARRGSGRWRRRRYAALVARGEATGSQLSADVPLLRIQVR